MTARALWDRLNAEGWKVVEEWRDAPGEESEHLEFTVSRATGGKPDEAGRIKLAKALSGFANTEGGVLVFGVETTSRADKIDVVSGIRPVPKAEAFCGVVRGQLDDFVEPKVPGATCTWVPAPAGDGSGIVAVYVPASDHGPHRARTKHDEAKDKYFLRTPTSTAVMAHSVLAAMFGRPPTPRLRLRVARGEGHHAYSVLFEVRNVGPGWADDVTVRVDLLERRGGSRHLIGRALKEELAGPWVHQGGCTLSCTLKGAIRPDDRVPLTKLKWDDGAATETLRTGKDDDRAWLIGRLDARGMMPVHIDAPLIDRFSDPVMLPEDE